MLGVNQVTVHPDVENTAASLDKLNFATVIFAFKFVRQTGGFGVVVSNNAVFDSKGHCVPQGVVKSLAVDLLILPLHDFDEGDLERFLDLSSGTKMCLPSCGNVDFLPGPAGVARFRLGRGILHLEYAEVTYFDPAFARAVDDHLTERGKSGIDYMCHALGIESSVLSGPLDDISLDIRSRSLAHGKPLASY